MLLSAKHITICLFFCAVIFSKWHASSFTDVLLNLEISPLSAKYLNVCVSNVYVSYQNDWCASAAGDAHFVAYTALQEYILLRQRRRPLSLRPVKKLCCGIGLKDLIHTHTDTAHHHHHHHNAHQTPRAYHNNRILFVNTHFMVASDGCGAQAKHHCPNKLTSSSIQSDDSIRTHIFIDSILYIK